MYSWFQRQQWVLVVSLAGVSACGLEEVSSKGERPSTASQQEESGPEEKPWPHAPELSEADKQKTRVRYSWGGTESACGPIFILNVFEDGTVYCRGSEAYFGDGDCPPAWGGIETMGETSAGDWIELVRKRISKKTLGTSDCAGAWSNFKVYVDGDIEVRTKNLACEEGDATIKNLEAAGDKLWREYCLQFKPSSEDDGDNAQEL